MTPEEIQVGLAVSHETNPGRIGILTGQRMDAPFPMAEVNWGNNVEFIDVERLQSFAQNIPRTIGEDIQANRYGTIDDLWRRITFEKLRGTLTDMFYSMKTSNIDFYPHQFKPVLRFVESATNRLLIADEVGLGKTIEAGLIWTEWQARERARRLLIVCPPTLVPKWIREMQDRFQLAAAATDAKQLLDKLEQFDRRGAGISFVLVASYHALRPIGDEKELVQQLRNGDSLEEVSKNLHRTPTRVKLMGRIREQAEEALTGGSDAVRFLDMVVFDEAHVMKNTASASYLAGEILSASAAATLCLSATPIHNESRDLYALLRLIDPEVFRDESGFDNLARQNLPVVRLQNELAKQNWDRIAIDVAISDISHNAIRTNLRDLIEAFDDSGVQRAKLRHTTERANLLGNFINRTRKRDVIEKRVLRQPVTFRVTMSPQERALYWLILQMIRAETKRQGRQITSFHLIQPALRMSSCLPVVAEDLRAGRWGELDDFEQIEEDFDFEDGEEIATTVDLGELKHYDFEVNDTKYLSLRDALGLMMDKHTFQDDKKRDITINTQDKIIIFAFFKSTIAYLKRRLDDDGFKVIAVTGDTTDKEERDRILQSFANDDSRILLCSEIGAEGVDLQFARVLINYDLPWNPMRVEQRIGRIDRIGQNSPSIAIINFYAEGTIDGNVFAHLYRKIGIFEQSIGALEGILGDTVSKLTSQILSAELTPEQMAEQVEQTGTAILNQEGIQSALEESAGALLAFQDLLSDKVGESQRLGKFIRPQELRQHVEDFLATTYQGAKACYVQSDNPAPDCMQIKFSINALWDFEQFCNIHEYGWPDGFARNAQFVSMTFDPAVYESQRSHYRSLVLVTHLHPFFRWITDANSKRNNDWHKVSALQIQTAAFDPGRYFYLIHRLSLDGITRRDAFYYAAISIDSGDILQGNEAELLVKSALENGRSAFPPPATTPDYTYALSEVRAVLAQDLAEARLSFKEDQDQKFEIRKQQLLNHFDRKIASQAQSIATMRARGDSESRMRGFQSILENLKTRRQDFLEKLEARRNQTTETVSEVACGIIDNQP